MDTKSKKVIEQTIVVPSLTVAPEFSPIETLRWMRRSDNSLIKVTDINLLQNLDRIRELLGEDTYRVIMANWSSTPKQNPLSSDTLPDNIKRETMLSRYSQSAAERKAHLDYLTDRFSSFIESLKENVSVENDSVVASDNSTTSTENA